MRDYGDRDDDRERWYDDDFGPNRRGTWGQGPPHPGWGQGGDRIGQGGYRAGRFSQSRYGYGGGSNDRGWNRDRPDWDHRESVFGGYAGYGGYGDGGGYGGYAENRGSSGDDAYGGGYGAFGGGYGGGGRWERGGGRDAGSEGRGWRGRYAGVGPKNYQRSDERIREDVNDSLTSADLDASEIDVEASQGIVTLKGSVESRTDKRHAEDIADRVPGVRDVHNELAIVEHAQSVVDKAKEAVGVRD